MIERLNAPSDSQIEALARLWEASVRATHHFLTEEDIRFFRLMVAGGIHSMACLYVIREHRSENSPAEYTAFMGIGDDKIEMLFVDPRYRGHGLGRRLVEFAVRECGVRRVDANEQNTQAVGFYRRMGFGIESRDGTDPAGKPYPVLHLVFGKETSSAEPAADGTGTEPPCRKRV